MDGKMGPLFPKVVPYEKQARLRLFGGVIQSQFASFKWKNTHFSFFCFLKNLCQSKVLNTTINSIKWICVNCQFQSVHIFNKNEKWNKKIEINQWINEKQTQKEKVQIFWVVHFQWVKCFLQQDHDEQCCVCEDEAFHSQFLEPIEFCVHRSISHLKHTITCPNFLIKQIWEIMWERFSSQSNEEWWCVFVIWFDYLIWYLQHNIPSQWQVEDHSMKLHKHEQHLQQIAKMLSASNFDSLKNLTSNKTKFSKNTIIQ
jgi:hypothetical protein